MPAPKENTMPSFDDVLSEITDESAQEIKAKLQSLLQQAKEDSSAFVRHNAAAVQQWVVERSTGELDQDEFDQLTAAQLAAAEQFANTQAIEVQARTRDLTVTVINIAAKKVVPLIVESR
jgi:hypothetical protein